MSVVYLNNKKLTPIVLLFLERLFVLKFACLSLNNCLEDFIHSVTSTFIKLIWLALFSDKNTFLSFFIVLSPINKFSCIMNMSILVSLLTIKFETKGKSNNIKIQITKIKFLLTCFKNIVVDTYDYYNDEPRQLADEPRQDSDEIEVIQQ